MMLVRLFVLSTEITGMAVWLWLIHLSRWGIPDKESRTPFRVATGVVLIVTLTALTGTLFSLRSHLPITIVSYTPVVAMAFVIVPGLALCVVFYARKISAHKPILSLLPKPIDISRRRAA